MHSSYMHGINTVNIYNNVNTEHSSVIRACRAVEQRLRDSIGLDGSADRVDTVSTWATLQV